jgi:hypothetical protein
MNNAQMLDEYLLADENNTTGYEFCLLEISNGWGNATSMSPEFKAALDAEILRKLVHYKKHCTIETATDMVPHTRKYLAWDL